MDVLVPNNGAYCARLARIVKVLGRKLTTIDYSEAQQVSAADVDKALAADPSITHVALVHCETGAGVLNPLHEVAQVVARHGKGLIVDAMSSFGAIDIDASKTPFDAVIAAVENGTISEARLNESVYRVLQYKQLYGIFNP